MDHQGSHLACTLTTDHMLTLITLGRFPTVQLYHSLDLGGLTCLAETAETQSGYSRV